MRNRAVSLLFLSLCAPLSAKTDPAICGTHALRAREEMFLHRQSVRNPVNRLRRQDAAGSPATPAIPDAGNIAILEDSEGVVATRNEFNLDSRSITFTPVQSSASSYRVTVGDSLFFQSYADQATVVSDLGDDDSRRFPLSFPLSFFGQTYREIYLNSDGNLTFTRGDSASADRSLGRFVSGVPRIAPLFTDLDPTLARSGVKVLSLADRFVVSWIQVPLYNSNGAGSPQTFQVQIFADGHIIFTYNGADPDSAVVGITPGGLLGSTNLIPFISTPPQEYSSTIVERFNDTPEVDIVTAAQKFYRTHQDAYDYLVFFNTLGVSAGSGAVAYEVTVRNNRSGYGDVMVDDGPEYGSPRRLQAVMNMGPITQYPADPTDIVPSRSTAGDNTLTVLGHEAGHLFLAYASVRDPNDPDARPMLGRQLAHWSFYFNSEASLLEGNRIVDRGASASPRYSTTATVQGYAPLDQYLMGFRPPSEVPPTFYVQSPNSGSRSPQVGVTFNGARRDVTIQDIIAAEGRRTPDDTVAQRRFRFAFVVITPQGQTPAADVISRIERYRSKFESAYGRFADQRASADTALRRAVQLSLAPAAGVLQGSSATATVTLDAPALTNAVFTLRTPQGNLQAPASVTIAAGQRQVSFPVSGTRAGVEELSLELADPQYETAVARVQVLAGPATLQTVVVSGDQQLSLGSTPLPDPIRVRVVDANQLPYANVRVRAEPTLGGAVQPAIAVTDQNGIASFFWTTSAGPQNRLQIGVEGSTATPSTITALTRPTISGTAVNAASFQPGLSPGGIGTIFGASLVGGQAQPTTSQVQVLLNGQAVPVFYVSDQQINFLAPSVTTVGPGTISVVTQVGTSAPVNVDVLDVQPGVFHDTSDNGAILIAGTATTPQQQPVASGDVIEIYGTGLGALRRTGNGFRETIALPEVTIAGVRAEVLFSGVALGADGLYQVNVRIPAGVPSGRQPLVLTIAGKAANTVFLPVR